MDLKPDEIAAKVERVCAEMLAVSMLLLVCALAFSYRTGLKANEVGHKLFHSEENLAGIKKTVARMEAEQ